MSSVFTELCEVYLCKYQMNHNSLPKNHVFLKTLGSYLGPETSALTGLILISPPPPATPTSFVPGERELSFSPVAQSCLLNRGPVCCHAAKLRFFLSWGSCLNSFCLGSHLFVPIPPQKHYFPINYRIAVPYEGVLRVANITRLVRTLPGMGSCCLP